MYRRYSSYGSGSTWPVVVGCVAVIALLIGLIAWLDGFKDPNYAGTGNDFNITATVTGVTDESVLVDEITVNQASGQATDWFTTDGGWLEANHKELHNNYSGGDFWSSKHRARPRL